MQKINDRVNKILLSKNILYTSKDLSRPWGGFFVIDPMSKEAFIDAFYPDMKNELMSSPLPLSPKILCVAPGKRLSWQYHHRRAELWRLIDGQAAYSKSDNDEQGLVRNMTKGVLLTLACGKRHRLIGRDRWGIVAEIWKHTDAAHPSDEDDIVRLQDDFGR
jgi:mannose-6-phosphate isomerase-like protein (cupin superfamily)